MVGKNNHTDSAKQRHTALPKGHAILKKLPFKKYLLVTSAIHMKRAKIYFKHFGISTIPAPSDFPNSLISIIPSAYNMALYEMALHEYIGIVRFKLYQFFNLN